ncbi:MAG: hypothetical protein R2713_20640 [Ilumatobacteraceae bacterium]
MLELRGTFGPIDGTIVERELARLTELIREADEQAGIVRTPAQRRAAALVEMATRSATAPADRPPTGAAVRVVVGSDTMDHLCELSNGIVVRPGQLVPWIRRAMLGRCCSPVRAPCSRCRPAAPSPGAATGDPGP